MIYLKLFFLVLFFVELSQLRFKKKLDKYVWFVIVLFFGAFGYCFYLAFKKGLVIKRKFSPNFNHHNLQTVY